MNIVEHFQRNTSGRDFVVGDVHGCFPELAALLRHVHFMPEIDRLFSVGDLVDRGTHSIDAPNWLAQPWFHAVRGNHEQMAIGVAMGRHDWDHYRRNGGAWFLDLHHTMQADIGRGFDQMPLCIDVETRHGLVGIVHADIIGNEWRAFTTAAEMAGSKSQLRLFTQQALWSREAIEAGHRDRINDLAAMYVGHSPLRQVTQLGNTFYMDTAAVFGNALTLMDLDKPGVPISIKTGNVATTKVPA